MRVFWSAEDDGYIALCPELGDLSAFGKTPEDAVKELDQAIDLALQTYRAEGWKVPAPYVGEEFSGQFRLRVSKSLHAWLARRAELEGVSLNALVTQLLSEARGNEVAMSLVSRHLLPLTQQLSGALRVVSVKANVGSSDTVATMAPRTVVSPTAFGSQDATWFLQS